MLVAFNCELIIFAQDFAPWEKVLSILISAVDLVSFVTVLIILMLLSRSMEKRKVKQKT